MNTKNTYFGSKMKHLSAAILIALSQSPGLYANPTGPAIVNGTVSIDTSIPGVMNITNTPNAIINWQGFSIQQNEITRFIQQGSHSAVLNRVISRNPSQILGQLLSNGQVFLINPNGIVFGPHAHVNVHSLIASTLNLSNNAFLSGNYHFIAGDNANDLENQGIIHTGKDGNLVLIAPNIDNSGVLESDGGKITLAAGEKLTLTSLDNPEISFEVQAPDNEILNVGEILSEGGAIDLFAGNITHSGIINANSVEVGDTGEIRLVAQDDINLADDSLVSASGTEGADGGDISIVAEGTDDPDNNAVVYQQGDIEATGRTGGDVQIEADTMVASGSIDVDGLVQGGTVDVDLNNRLLAVDDSSISADGVTAGTIHVEADESLYTSGDYSATGVIGGEVHLLGNEVKLATADVDVSGSHGGGDIRVGGGFKGTEEGVTNAENNTVNAGTELKADASINGDGGTVVVWADGETRFNGFISATGGIEGGDGGLAEVSGKEALGYNGLVDLSSPLGEAGSLLLDPTNIRIFGTTDPQMIELVDPNPGASNFYGDNASTLANGQIYIIDELDDAAGADAGAFYIFDSTTGDLLTSITGTQAGDKIGDSGVTPFGYISGYYWLRSPSWGNDKGALTLFQQDAGISGVVGSANSLVGLNAESTAGAGDGDRVGGNFYYYSDVVSLGANKFIARHRQWGEYAGALTWFDMTGATSGSVNGVVNSTTSLVGSSPSDNIGQNYRNLYSNNMWAFYSPNWDNGAATNAGAITFIDATTGITGVLGSSNSLVGSTTDDQVGRESYYDYRDLGSNKFAFFTPYWDNTTASAVDAGAITIVDTTLGISGAVSETNSLVGTHSYDHIGYQVYYDDFNARYFPNHEDVLYIGSNIIFKSHGWNGLAGALTWYDPTTVPITGPISSTNSLVGSTAGDLIGGSQISPLYDSTGNWYYIHSPEWNSDAGAVTFFDNTTGIAGTISDTNGMSLVGSNAGDMIGSGSSGLMFAGSNPAGGQTYIIASPEWNGTAAENDGMGAITWIDSDNLVYGAIGSANSLVGTTQGDEIGSNIELLQSFTDTVGTGNDVRVYASISPNWDNTILTTPAVDAGAITLFDGNTGSLYGGGSLAGGVINSTSSLIGTHDNDQIGLNGIERVGYAYNTTYGQWTYRYGIPNPQWNNNTGAFTWFELTDGINGEVSGLNSFVLNFPGDGNNSSLVDLGGYKWLLIAPEADEVGAVDVGAITWFDGSTGLLANGVDPIVGSADPSKGILGPAGGSKIGNAGVQSVSSGYYVIRSEHWTDGGGADKGALTLFDRNTGTFYDTDSSAFVPMLGPVDATNSLVGTSAGDSIGASFLHPFGTARLIVRSPLWDNVGAGVIADAGAVREFVNYNLTGMTGTHTTGNSLYGANPNDMVGSGGLLSLSSGYLIHSPEWNGARGAVTRLGTGLITGAVSSTNSLVGANAGDRIGSAGVINLGFQDTAYKSLLLSPDFDGAKGAITLFDNLAPLNGVVGAGNSLLGTTAGDLLDVTLINESQLGYLNHYAIVATKWDNGTAVDAGAVTFFDAEVDEFLSGGAFAGTITSSNSLVGTHANDQIGSEGIYTITSNTNAYLRSNNWNGGAGAWTWIGDFNAGVTGAVGSSNSLVGSSPGDMTDYFTASDFSDNKYGLFFYNWDNTSTSAIDAGAITIFDRSTGVTGVIGTANSLVGDQTNDRIGTFDPDYIYSYRRKYVQSQGGSSFVILSPDWHNGAGALTWFDTSSTLPKGVISSTNSLVGSHDNDRLGITYTYYGYVGMNSLGSGRYALLSPYWNSHAGAITWFDGATGVTGVLGASNSLVGSTANDGVGENGLPSLGNGRYLIRTPYWDNGTNTDAGAITITDINGLTGTISSSNSLVGTHTGDRVGDYYFSLGTNRYLFRSLSWNSSAGALTWYDSSTNLLANAQAPVGAVSSTNSLVGSTAGDQVGWSWVNLGNDQYAFRMPYWDNGSFVDAGAITIYDITTGMVGEVSATNSLVGTHANDRVGWSYTSLGDSKWLFNTIYWNEERGAVTWYDALGGLPLIGPVTADNSLIGELAGDRIGDRIISLGGNKAYISSSSASVGGLTNAGRAHIFFYPVAAPQTDVAFADAPADLVITASAVKATLDLGTDLTLQATNNITIDTAIGATGSGNLILQAGQDILINQDVTLGSGSTLTATANDTTGGGTRVAGTGDIIMASGTTLTANTINLIIDADAALPAYEPGIFDLANVSGSTSLTHKGEGGLPNTGLLSLGPGETFTINGSLNNTGTIDLGLGSQLILLGAGVQLDNAGTFSGFGSVTIDGGTGTLFNSGGVLRPGASPGALSITGNLDLTGGTLIMDVEGLPNTIYPTAPDLNDYINVTGDVTLGGLLTINTVAYTGQAIGDTFNFIQAGGVITGAFASTNFGIYGYGTDIDLVTYPELLFVTLTSLGAPAGGAIINDAVQSQVVNLTQEAATITTPLDTDLGAAEPTSDEEQVAAADTEQTDAAVESIEEYESLEQCN